MEEKNKIEALTLFEKCKELHEVVIKTSIMMEKFSDRRWTPGWKEIFTDYKIKVNGFEPRIDTVSRLLSHSFGHLWRTADTIKLLYSSLPEFTKNKTQEPDMIRSLPTRDEDILYYVQMAIDACVHNTILLINDRLKHVHNSYEKFTVVPRDKEWDLRPASNESLDVFVDLRIFQVNALIAIWLEIQKAIPEVV